MKLGHRQPYTKVVISISSNFWRTHDTSSLLQTGRRWQAEVQKSLGTLEAVNTALMSCVQRFRL